MANRKNKILREYRIALTPAHIRPVGQFQAYVAIQAGDAEGRGAALVITIPADENMANDLLDGMLREGRAEKVK